VEQLLPRSHADHVQFCRYLEGQPQLMNYILFMDEAQFDCDDISNTRDSH